MKYTQEEIGTIWRGHKTLDMLNMLLAITLNENSLLEKVFLRKKKGNANFLAFCLLLIYNTFTKHIIIWRENVMERKKSIVTGL